MNIPSHYHNFEGHPFTHCNVCNSELIESQTRYTIEKAIRRYGMSLGVQVVFEHAICITCAKGLSSKISRDSKRHIQDYFQKAIMANSNEFDGIQIVEIKENKCLISGIDLAECDEYQMYASCLGDQLDTSSQPPFALSGEIMERLQEVLSPETKEFLDDFMQDKFGIPPEWEGKKMPRPIML